MMRRHSWLFVLGTVSILGCGGDDGGPSGSTGTISGTVTSALSGAALAGATVAAGTLQAPSDANGQYELTGVRTGSVVIGAGRPGFQPYSATITVQEGSNAHNIMLSPQETYGYTDFALFVPAGVTQVRAVIVALGGPDTRAFVDGRPAGAPSPAAEAATQALGIGLRTLAQDSGFAILGTGLSGLPNEGTNDGLLLGALQTGAALSGHPELSTAPLIPLGISGGGPEAFGLTIRQVARVAAFALRNPSAMSDFLFAAVQQVPGYINLSGADGQVDNAATTQVFLDNRADGAIWELALEPDAEHYVSSADARAVLIQWIAAASGLRLPASPGGALRGVAESSGWLGNRATYDTAPFASYPDDASQASWLVNAEVAGAWKVFVTP